MVVPQHVEHSRCLGRQPLLKTIPGLVRAGMGVFYADNSEDLPSIRTPHKPCEPVRSTKCAVSVRSGAPEDSMNHCKLGSAASVEMGVVRPQQSRLPHHQPRSLAYRDRLASPSYHLPCIDFTAAFGVSYQLSETFPRK